MLDASSARTIIEQALLEVHFDKVSDLSKNEFTEVLALAITSVLNDSAFSDGISTELADRSVRRSRGRL